METSNSSIAIVYILLIISIVAIVSNAITLFQFIKQKGSVYKINYYLLSINIFIVIFYFIFALITFILTKKDSDSKETFMYLTMVLTLVLFSIIWFFLERIAISINEEKILFFGSSIKLKNILSVVFDEEQQKLFINYLPNKILKTISFKKDSPFSIFIIENQSKTDLKILNTNQREWINKYEFASKLEK